MPLSNQQHKDNFLFERLQRDEQKGLELLFKKYHARLCRFAQGIVHTPEMAEDVVQDVFFTLWHKRHQLTIRTSLQSYLFRSVRNIALNHVNKQIRHQQHEAHFANDAIQTVQDTDQNVELDDLRKKLHVAIQNLPQRCQQVFTLSRFENMTYREIATTLEISNKTVEHQMSKALATIRTALKGFLVLLCYFFTI